MGVFHRTYRKLEHTHDRDNVDRLRDRAEVTSQLTSEVANRFRHSTGHQILLGWTEVIANGFPAWMTRISSHLAVLRAGVAVVRVAHFLALIAAALGNSATGAKVALPVKMSHG